MSGMTGDRGWAVRVSQRVEAGESVARIAVDWAADVLGRPLLRGGKHARRPDAKDRQAGDFHSDDDQVPI